MSKMLKWSGLLLLGLLAGCASETAPKPELHTIGTVEMEKLITPATYNELGYEKFREKYLGQEVTLTGFSYNKRTGSTNNKLQCKLSFKTINKELDKKITVHVYTNFYTDEMLNWSLKNHDDVKSELFAYSEEIALPESACNPECEYDAINNTCFYRSKDLVLTGKVFQVYGEEGLKNVSIYIKLKGAKY